jgi:hypothetical protein
MATHCAIFTGVADRVILSKTCLRPRVKCPLFVSDFNEKSGMLTDSSKHSQYKLSRKYHAVEAEIFFFPFGRT